MIKKLYNSKAHVIPTHRYATTSGYTCVLNENAVTSVFVEIFYGQFEFGSADEKTYYNL